MYSKDFFHNFRYSCIISGTCILLGTFAYFQELLLPFRYFCVFLFLLDVRDYVDSCDFCAAAVEMNYPAPMTEREMPDAPWQHCSADFKGPVGGQYCFHVLIDNYSRWPKVEVVKSTSALDRSLEFQSL